MYFSQFQTDHPDFKRFCKVNVASKLNEYTFSPSKTQFQNFNEMEKVSKNVEES